MPTLVFAALALQVAAMDDPAQRHETCLSLIGQNAEVAYEEALAWRYQGGGWPSEHCVSLALIALGQAEAGAARLRAAAEGAVTATDASRAIMFARPGTVFYWPRRLQRPCPPSNAGLISLRMMQVSPAVWPKRPWRSATRRGPKAPRVKRRAERPMHRRRPMRCACAPKLIWRSVN